MTSRLLTLVAASLVSALPLLAGCQSAPAVAHPPVTADRVHRVTTAVPFPRGLVMLDGELYVLCRGRVRESGGADGAIDDKAGTIFRVNPNVSEPIVPVASGAANSTQAAAGAVGGGPASGGTSVPTAGSGGGAAEGGRVAYAATAASPADVSAAVRENGQVYAAPTSPPFRLFDRTAKPATKDRETDRPYCGLRYDPTTKNFYLCAFSGIDKQDVPNAAPGTTAAGVFSKNLSDALFRFDTRTRTWHVVERHDIEKGGVYPHHDASMFPPPHGLLNGPDNCLVVGTWLYAVAKDNSVLAMYDLREIAANPAAPPPAGRVVLNYDIPVAGPLGLPAGTQQHWGHSMLAARDGYLYVGFRSSSTIVRLPLAADGQLKPSARAELIARFDPFDPKTRKSANLTDMVFGPDGDLYVISAQPSRVYRFRPDPRRVFDARTGVSGAAKPWADLAALTNHPKMKSENLLVDEKGRVFVTSGDAYAYQAGAGGTVYRIDP
jgi:hypothetical protein